MTYARFSYVASVYEIDHNVEAIKFYKLALSSLNNNPNNSGQLGYTNIYQADLNDVEDGK